MIEKIIQHSKKRVDNYGVSNEGFYKGSETFFEVLANETEEALAEHSHQNSIYLEDELGDIFWDYMCLLHSLTKEGKITSPEKVFERCYSKFSERILPDGATNGSWSEIKKIQKERLKKEHNKKYHDK